MIGHRRVCRGPTRYEAALLDGEREHDECRDPQLAPASREATRVAGWFPGRARHRDRGAERLFRSVSRPYAGIDGPGVGPADRLSCPLCDDLVCQRQPLSPLGLVPCRYVLAPHIDSLLAGRAHPDSQAVVFLNAIREAGPRLAQYPDYMQSGVMGSHA